MNGQDGGHGQRLQAECRSGVVWVGAVEGWRIRGRGAYLAAIRQAKALQAETNNQNRRQIAACMAGQRGPAKSRKAGRFRRRLEGGRDKLPFWAAEKGVGVDAKPRPRSMDDDTARQKASLGLGQARGVIFLGGEGDTASGGVWL